MIGLRHRIFLACSQRVFYGWIILSVAGLGVFASAPGQSHNFSVFVGPISADLGISSALIASAYGAATLIAAFALPYMGRLVDRHGSRRMSLIVVVLLGLACLAFGAAMNLAWLAIGFAVLRFLGQGALMLNSTNLVAQWFSRRRGFAMSLMALGVAFSMAVHPPLGQALIEHFGWRQAWVVLGLITWALMVPPILLLLHDRPEDIGLVPDGPARDGLTPAESAREEARSGDALRGLDLRQARRSPAFYILAAGMALMSMLGTGLHFYQVSILTSQGLDASLAARTFPVLAIAMVLAMPLVGRLLDRFRTRYVFAAGLMLTSASLLAASLVAGPISALAYAVIFGVTNAAGLTLFGYVWPRYFGRRHLGSIQGTGQTIGVVGASLGPLPLGLAFDHFASYDGALQLLAILPILCAVPALFLRTPPGVPVDERLE